MTPCGRRVRSFVRAAILAVVALGSGAATWGQEGSQGPIRSEDQPVPLRAPAPLTVAEPGDSLHGALGDALTEFDRALELQERDPREARRRFRTVAQSLESIAAGGVTNGYLEFNTGNAWLHAGEVGRAILHYRRAERLIPSDPMLQVNLRTARSRCLTYIPPRKTQRIVRDILFLHYGTSMRTRLLLAASLYVAVWVLLMFRLAFRRRGLVIAAILAAVLCVSVSVSIAGQRWWERRATPGVVTGIDVTVRKGPGSGYERQFVQPLQPGVEFVVKELRGDWWRIGLSDGQGGWIESSAAELIVPRAPAPSLALTTR
jgi:hypothetical protein